MTSFANTGHSTIEDLGPVTGRVVLPRFGGHLKIGTMMCLEVFYVEEKTL